jgi:hypothetical protein
VSAREFAGQMRELIEELKAKGTAAIYCDNLIAYLREVEQSPEPEPSALEIEKFKADLQNWVESNKYTHEGALEHFRSVISSGQSAIKSSFLLNGGGAIALLAFTGHLAQFNPGKVAAFGTCILPFAFGVLSIAVTAGLTYLSQWFYASPRPWAFKVGFALNLACIVLGIVSYGLFSWGLFAAYRAFIAYA